MPAVFVHGNPETSAIWTDLLDHLERGDVVTLSPPGFGAPVPDGFACTSDEYRDWLVAELEAIDGDIDLVGHDWGGGHVVRAVQARPDLVRTWATDVLGLFDPDYVWHDRAQVWQTEGAGEEAIAEASAADRLDIAVLYQALGMTEAAARDCADANDEAMGAAVLALYRSAKQPIIAQIGADLGNLSTRPGLAIVAAEDHFVGGEALARRVAERTGAEVAILPDLGHWWMMQDPAQGARMLEQFWAD